MIWPNRSGKGNRPFTLLLSVFLILIGAIAFSACASNAPATIATVERISPAAYNQQFGGGEAHTLIDVRTPEEYASGHIEGAVNIPVDSLQQRLDEVSRDLPVIVYCRTGNRSAPAAQILVNAGYIQVYDLGGIQSWITAGFPIIQ